VLRYGEEIGMGDNLRLKERYAIRTPMQWSAEPNAGFSTAAELVRPVVDQGAFAYERVNVEQQLRDSGSLLRSMIRMIRLRKQCPEIGWGEWRILPSGARSVLAIEYHWRGSTIVCVHNLSSEPQEAAVRADGDLFADLLDVEEIAADARGVHRIPLEAYGYRWFRVGALNQALARGAPFSL
jgi:maltose alpha-D-glucosyltransferase / alpha-amylase